MYLELDSKRSKSAHKRVLRKCVFVFLHYRGIGVFWAKAPLYPYNVKTQKTHFLKIPEWADFDLLESNCRHIFLHKNQKIYHSGFFSLDTYSDPM